MTEEKVSTDDIVASIRNFLHSEVNAGGLSDDQIETVTAAEQLLGRAFGSQNGPIHDLREVFKTAPPPLILGRNLTDSERADADDLKRQGNELMASEQYEEACARYTSAIAIDVSNSVYYSNRAAAYNRMRKFENAISDCQKAIRINPSYGKAYGRLGMAHLSLDQLAEAEKYLSKAVELEPGNSSFSESLNMARERLGASSGSPFDFMSAAGAGAAGAPPGAAPFDIASLLGNPAIQQMTQRMMSNPQVTEMMEGFMSSMRGGHPPGGDGAANPAAGESDGGQAPAGAPPFDMEMMMQFGQQMAQEMQQADPEAVERLRQEYQTAVQPPSDESNSDSATQPRDPSADADKDQSSG